MKAFRPDPRGPGQKSGCWGLDLAQIVTAQLYLQRIWLKGIDAFILSAAPFDELNRGVSVQRAAVQEAFAGLGLEIIKILPAAPAYQMVLQADDLVFRDLPGNRVTKFTGYHNSITAVMDQARTFFRGCIGAGYTVTGILQQKGVVSEPVIRLTPKNEATASRLRQLPESVRNPRFSDDGIKTGQAGIGQVGFSGIKVYSAFVIHQPVIYKLMIRHMLNL